MNKDYKFWLIVAVIVIIDQLTKLFARMLDSPKVILEGIFQFNFVKNTGAGFSLFQNIPNSNLMLIFTTLIILGIIFFNYDKIDKGLHMLMAFIVGGALGNLIDRIFLGYVVDFFDFYFWPVFNIADSAITISGILILIKLIKNEER